MPRFNTTADGVDVNALWDEVQAVLSAWNAERNAVASLLSHYAINAADAVPQSISDDSFEEASEFGEPESLRAPSNAILLTGANTNGLGDYDVRYPLDPNAESGASEFSWGAGIEPQPVRGRPPSEGGRYLGQSPPCERHIGK